MNQETAASTTRWFSLRRRLLALLLGGVTLGWAASLALSYHDAHHEIDEIFDANLVQVGQMLLALASEYDDDDDIARLPPDVHKYQKKIVFQLWTRDGYLLLRSRHAPTVTLTQEDGFSEAIGADQARWRYYNQWDVERGSAGGGGRESRGAPGIGWPHRQPPARLRPPRSAPASGLDLVRYPPGPGPH
jgi:hypothetical protein